MEIGIVWVEQVHNNLSRTGEPAVTFRRREIMTQMAKRTWPFFDLRPMSGGYIPAVGRLITRYLWGQRMILCQVMEAGKPAQLLMLLTKLPRPEACFLRANYYDQEENQTSYFGMIWMGNPETDKTTKQVKRDVKTNGISVKSEKLLKWNRLLIKGIN
jgi:hypothetical protein